ncbi:MAG: polyprenyl synthetase family protein [Bacteroidia bacterium]|nr:polyprenyl synthetase family protein [Bacteroidia bacterium]MDW8158541.1 polyprenyl synthetase family protein [Bacteroidia bacterium]
MNASVEKLITSSLSELETYLNSLVFPPTIAPSLHYALQVPGKRFRPLLLLLTYQTISGSLDVHSVLPAAVAIELFHNFTLVHDDIMDNAPLRRGKPSLYAHWGTNTAILAGDALFALCLQQLTSLESPMLVPICSAFSKMAVGVCEGQMLDLQIAKEGEISLEQYLEMIRLKTALLFGTSLQIGSLLATPNPKLAFALYHYGEAMGMAFQLQDDLLDLYSSQSGKQLGGDIIEKKHTFLWVKALEVALPEQKLALLAARALENPEDRIRETRNLFEQLQIKEKTQFEICTFLENAQKAVVNVEASFQPALEVIHSYVTQLFEQQASLL